MTGLARQRTRIPSPKPGMLEAIWGREDRHSGPSVVYLRGGEGSRRADALFLSTLFECRHVDTGAEIFGRDGRSFVAELDARGYDITTLRFSIRKKPAVP